MLKKRNSMSAVDVCNKSAVIGKKLLEILEANKNKSILFYAASKNEVQTFKTMRLCKKNKRIFLPITDPIRKELTISELFDPDNEIAVGKWGIPVPKKEYRRYVPPSEIDTVIVPGIAFDKTGGRIGFGGGYYDRFLSKLPLTVLTIGLCYDFQVKNEALPLTTNDIKINTIITENQCVNCIGDKRTTGE